MTALSVMVFPTSPKTPDAFLTHYKNTGKDNKYCTIREQFDNIYFDTFICSVPKKVPFVIVLDQREAYSFVSMLV